MKRAKRIYLTIIILSLVIIAVSTYYTLGGFDPVDVFVMEGKSRTVIGNEYIEKFEPSTFKQKMDSARSAINSGVLDGMLTVVFYENEMIGADSVHYFLGASKDQISDVLKLPAGYEYQEFKTDKVFKVFITQHWLVRPSPAEVAEIVKVKAIEEGEVLLPFSFELYYEDESLSVEFWAR